MEMTYLHVVTTLTITTETARTPTITLLLTKSMTSYRYHLKSKRSHSFVLWITLACFCSPTSVISVIACQDCTLRLLKVSHLNVWDMLMFNWSLCMYGTIYCLNYVKFSIVLVVCQILNGLGYFCVNIFGSICLYL